MNRTLLVVAVLAFALFAGIPAAAAGKIRTGAAPDDSDVLSKAPMEATNHTHIRVFYIDETGILLPPVTGCDYHGIMAWKGGIALAFWSETNGLPGPQPDATPQASGPAIASDEQCPLAPAVRPPQFVAVINEGILVQDPLGLDVPSPPCDYLALHVSGAGIELAFYDESNGVPGPQFEDSIAAGPADGHCRPVASTTGTAIDIYDHLNPM